MSFVQAFILFLSSLYLFTGCESKVIGGAALKHERKENDTDVIVLHKQNVTNVAMKDKQNNTGVAPKDKPNVTDIPLVCQKSYFMKEYIEKDKYISIDYMRETCNQFTKICDDSPAERVLYSVIEVVKQEKYIIRVQLLEILKRAYQDCWAMAIEVVSKQSVAITYFNYNKEQMTDNRTFDLQYSPGVVYNFTIALLPTGRTFEFSVKAPGRCELEILHDIHRKLVIAGLNETCLDHIDFDTRYGLASYLCKVYELDIDYRRELVKNQLVILKNCTMIFQNNSQHQIINDINGTNENNNSKTDLTILIIALVAAASVLFGVCICYFAVLKRKNRRCKMSSYSLSEKVPDRELLQSTKVPSVMILNRPGCELLECFLRDLAFILKSYNIDVKLTLLERNQLDAEGGIASYMQRNIDKCDYVLLMFTENTQEENPILKHKPYEFALRVIGGLAYHQNSCSRYIPAYLSSYKDSVHLLPSFLNASTTFGYQLPKDIEKFICSVLQRDVLENSKERLIKNEFFINRMKDFRKKILEAKHENCSRENCYKGTIFASVSNLSSIWPSTINSKWPSFKSVDQEVGHVRLSEIDEEYLDSDKLLHPRRDMIINSITNNHVSLTQIINNFPRSRSDDDIYKQNSPAFIYNNDNKNKHLKTIFHFDYENYLP